MDKYINEHELDDSMGDKVLIATLFRPKPVLLAANRLGPDRLILLIDKESIQEQKKSLKLIKDSLGLVIDIKEVKTSAYDIVDIAKKCVDIIDMQPKDDKIFVNVTSGRKTKAMGLLFAAYARCKRISKIAYFPEEQDQIKVVYLPKLGFKLTDSQKILLEAIDEHPKDINYVELAKKIGTSRAMLYNNIKELKDMDYISTDDGLELTDAGRIARL